MKIENTWSKMKFLDFVSTMYSNRFFIFTEAKAEEVDDDLKELEAWAS